MSDLNAGPEEALSAAAAQVAGRRGERRRTKRRSARLGERARRAERQHVAKSSATTAGVFQPLSKVAPTSTRNDIDMILDIPVQMTVELGRTKLAIRQPAATRARFGRGTGRHWPASRWTCSSTAA